MTTNDTDRPPKSDEAALQMATTSQAFEHLLQRVSELGVPYGREDSFKMAPGRMLQNRVLIGIQSTHLRASAFFDIASELGMPGDCPALLLPQMAQANALFFGIEDRPGGSVCKVYLEFWDRVRQQVRRTGAKTPLLLHMGVKWDSALAGRHELARYMCYPLLSNQDILRRMAAVYPHNKLTLAGEAALGMVCQGVKRNPTASLLYLEASEGGNPRCSFDVNLYKTGMRVADAGPELRLAAGHLGISPEAIEAQLQRLGSCPLGHLSGGTDRHGDEFLSVYGEIQALPA